LVTVWLAAPWRFPSRSVILVGLATVGRRQPVRLLAVGVINSVVIAVVQAVQQRQWAVAVTLTAVAVCSVVCPLADAAVGRRSEYAADRYALAVGLGPQLAAAVQVLSGGRRRPKGIAARLLSRHPDVDRRIAALGSVADRGLPTVLDREPTGAA
jgi:Zn-dependent protease with chaperone function